MAQSNDDFVFFAQQSSLPLALEQHLKNWIVQREEGKKPSLLKQEEINHLAFLSVTCLRQRALGQNKGNAWAPLLPLLENWVVRRQKGEVPSKLTANDCQDLVRLVLKALITPVYIHRESKQEDSGSEKPREEDPLAFLREHLAQGL